MQVGTNEEIQAQQAFVYQAERDLMKAKLRLRALKGESLTQIGDSFPVHTMMLAIDELMREFGGQNLQAM